MASRRKLCVGRGGIERKESLYPIHADKGEGAKLTRRTTTIQAHVEPRLSEAKYEYKGRSSSKTLKKL